MDLVHGAKRITVVMEHTIKDGSPRLVRECTRPLTGKALVDRVITDLAILDVEAGTFRVVELAPGADPETIEQRTDAPLRWQRTAQKAPRSSAASTLERQTWSLCATRQPPVHKQQTTKIRRSARQGSPTGMTSARSEGAD